MTDPIAAPTLITSGIALFTIANPIGSLPVFLEITKDLTPARQRRTGLLVGVAVVVLFFGPAVRRLLGRSGMDVLTRVFGLLLLAIAVQSILSALGDAFPGWTAG